MTVLSGGCLTTLKERIPAPLRTWLRGGRSAARRASVLVNGVTDWSVLRRLRPYRPDFGFHYGKPIDRYYIERFLAAHAGSIRGCVAEIGDDKYARLFGGDRIRRCEIIDIDDGNKKRTIPLDLAQTASAPENFFDSILCIQTLFEIFDHAAAIASLHKMLKSGGVLLATVPGISQRVPPPMLGGGGDWWRYTADSANSLFAESFGSANVEISTYGNVLSSVALLHGLVRSEFTQKELDFNHLDYEVIVGIVATKRALPDSADHPIETRALTRPVSIDRKARKLRHLVPAPARTWLNWRKQAAERKFLLIDRVTDWSVLRRVRPYRSRFGERRGECIDRYYIERFLAEHKQAIRGRTAEILGTDYIQMFGEGRVEKVDVLDIDETNPLRTITLDLIQTAAAPEGLFDCVICTQTLLLIRNCEAAIQTLHKILKPRGTLLVTFPGISQRIPRDMLGGADGDWWRFTAQSAERLFANVFGGAQVTVQTYGNVLSAAAFLHGLVQEELTREELDFHDPGYEVTIGVRAVKGRRE
ncbi:MAG TPA: methyltransferase domain-containing protein [Bryobacteraceae bacterium]|nr:methyltransferase domain-containing protein [Bryobacteraceae bacterium]